MPLIIDSGWECGFIDLVAGFNNEGTRDGSPPVVSIVSGAWAGSPYSLRCNNSPGSGVADYNFSRLGPLGNLVATSVPTSYFRIDYKWEIKPSTNYETIFRLDNVSAAHEKFTLGLKSSRQLVALDRNHALMQTGTTVIPQSTKTTFYCSVGTGTNAPWEVRIGSSTATPEISGTGNLDTVNGGEIRIGKANNFFGNVVDFYFDNFAWRDDFYPAPGIVVMLVPVADGFYKYGVANGAPSKWQCIAEIPSDGDTSYINGLAAGQAYTAKVSSIFGTINSATAFASYKRDGGVNSTTSLRLRSGFIDTDTSPAGNAANPIVFRKIFETDPNTGLAWTPAGLSNAEVGIVQVGGGPIRLSSAYIMVDYNPLTPPGDGWASPTRPNVSLWK